MLAIHLTLISRLFPLSLQAEWQLIWKRHKRERKSTGRLTTTPGLGPTVSILSLKFSSAHSGTSVPSMISNYLTRNDQVRILKLFGHAYSVLWLVRHGTEERKTLPLKWNL